jgi:hypothetical protein
MVNKSLFSRLFGTARSSPEPDPFAPDHFASDASDPIVLPQEFPGFEHEAEAYAAEEPPLAARSDPHPSAIHAAATSGHWVALDPPAAISGAVDSLDADGASGWALDTVRPHAPVTVAAFLGEACIGEASAGIYRQDVEVRTGDGAHGFRLNFSPPMAPAQVRKVSVIAAAGRPCVLRAPEPEAPKPQAFGSEPKPQAFGSEAEPQALQETPGGASAPSLPHADVKPAAPIFIIGCAPDMAGKLALALMKAAGLGGSEFGHMLPLTLLLSRTVNQYYRNTLATAEPAALVRRVDAGLVQQAIRDVFIDLTRRQFPSGDWVDNSQGLLGIQSVPLLRGMWPAARFIFVSSRVIESLAARLASEQKREPRDLAAAWAREMQTWHDLRDRVGQAALSVDRFDLLQNPAEAAGRIAAFLKFDPAQTEELEQALLAAAAEIRAAPATQTAAGWAGQEDEALKLASEPMMTAYGYSWDQSYFAKSPADIEHAP